MLDTYLVQGLDIDIRYANPGPWQDLFECSDLLMAEQYILTEITATIINTKGSQIQVYTSADHRHWIMIFNGPRTTHYRIIPRTLKKVKPIDESPAEKVDIPEYLKEIDPGFYGQDRKKIKSDTLYECAEKIVNEMCNEEEMWYKSDKVYPCNPLPFGEWYLKPKDDSD